tara:strand:- start:499 stop:774 length:276 start_codon:yes stop_codon:yes gene_type:complete
MSIKVGDLVTTRQGGSKNPLESDNLGIVTEIIYDVLTSSGGNHPKLAKGTAGVANVFWFKFNQDKVGQLSCYQPVSYLVVVTSREDLDGEQ